MNAHVPQSDDVDLDDVIDHAKDTLDPLARETGAQLDVQRFDRPRSCAAIATSWSRCCENLVQNALKYG